MTSYLILRHGSNAANQSMTPTAAVAIVDARSRDLACRIAIEELGITCYGNQFLEAVPESKLSATQVDWWNEVTLRDAEARATGCDSIIYTA